MKFKTTFDCEKLQKYVPKALSVEGVALSIGQTKAANEQLERLKKDYEKVNLAFAKYRAKVEGKEK